ncbi:hypothetical protein ACF8GD_00165 [Pseudomonas putida]|uniref:hypothetical protein n=1 Tax=Pseudomonas putida TaxID=303 RepID=UPI00370A09CE
MGTAKTPAKAKAAAKEDAAQEQSTDTATAAAATAPGVVGAEQSGQQDQPSEGGQSNGEAAPAAPAAEQIGSVAEQGAQLAQALAVNEAGQLVVAADLVAPFESSESQALVGTSANVAVLDEDFEDVGEPWYGLQRAVSDVAIERLRQVHGEGFTLERDDAYTDGQLARAATCLLIPPAGLPRRLQNLHWPFAQEWLKPGLVRDDLVKAGALIIAEIERLDRAEAEA